MFLGSRTVGIFNLHCALYTHMLTNAKSRPHHTLVKVFIFKGKFCEDSIMLLIFQEDKLKNENDEILTYIKILVQESQIFVV